MKNIRYLSICTAGIAIATCFYSSPLQAQRSIIEPVTDEKPTIIKEADSTDKGATQKLQQTVEPKKIVIRFEDENLVDVIDFIAKQKGANVILPVGEKAITSKVTIRLSEKYTVDEAWDFLFTLLQMAGYNMVPRGENMYAILKIANAAQEPLPLYIGVNYEDLPDSDEPIRALFYFGNLKLSEDTANTFNSLLMQLLPPEPRTSGGTLISKFAIDPLANTLIISDKARTIKAVMKIVSHLERTEFKEKYEVLSLMHTSAEDVAKLFNETILKTVEPFPMGGPRKPVDSTYFSKNVRIVPENRLNIVLVFGREQAVDRVIDFIRTYIDVAPETGKSILHVYKLRYLDAEEFRKVLEQIVAYDTEGTTGQARVVSGQTSIERYFEGPPRILSDLPATVTTEGEALAPQYFGGNNLIIAARSDDWVKIKKLIEELDTPQPQIILEVLVADLNQDDVKMLGTFLRNPVNIPLARDLQFQSAQFNGVVTDNPVTPHTVGLFPSNPTNDADVLSPVAFNADGSPVPLGSTGNSSLAAVAVSGQPLQPIAPPGTTLLSLADPTTNKTWALMQILKKITHRKVISSPHIVAVHNQPAKISIGQERLVRDATTSGVGGAGTVINYKWIKANLEITITPRISVSENDMSDDRVQMTITVTIEDFQSTSDTNANRFTRSVQTTALLRSQEILPLGGLLRLDTTDSVNEVPLLGRIPIIGYFFKRRFAQAAKTNLTVFLCPTIVRPRFRWGADQITHDYVKLAKQYDQEGRLFESLKDPITRWFFEDEVKVDDVLSDFMHQDEMKREETNAQLIKTASNEVSPKDTALAANVQEISQEQEKLLKSMLEKQENTLLQV